MLEEAWALVEHDVTGRWVSDMARRSRHLGLALIAVTQQLDDLAASAHGKALLRQSSMQLFFHQQGDDLEVLREACKLSEREVDLIASLTMVRGRYSQAYWANGTRGRTKLELRHAPEVYWLATSDPIRDTPRRDHALRTHDGDPWAALRALAEARRHEPADGMAGSPPPSSAWMVTGLLLAPLGAVAPVPGPTAATPRDGEFAGIPAVYLPIYQAAAERYGVSWALLAAIHRQESDFSRLRAPSTVGDAVSGGWNGCGAAGPAQFGIVGVAPYHATVTQCPGSPRSGACGSWAHFRDAARGLARPTEYPQMAGRLPACRDTEPHGCVYDDVDALSAAAAYLHELGARSGLDARAWNAARAYNGAAIYADLVLAWAREYADAAGSSAFAPQLPSAPLSDATTTVPGARAVCAPTGAPPHPPAHPKPCAARSPPPTTSATGPTGSCTTRRTSTTRPTTARRRPATCSGAPARSAPARRSPAQLMRYGEPGPGRWITVYANSGHAYVIVAGLRFDTSDYNQPGAPNAGQSGPRWRLGPRPSTNFVVRHPPGL